jgi:GTP-binding protein LepA
MATGNKYFDEIGTLKLNQVPKQVSAGDVGYLISGIKEAKEVKWVIIQPMRNPTTNIITGLKMKPMVLWNLSQTLKITKS